MVMKPPSGGPITGPISAGTVTQAIALTSALLSIERSSTSRPTGVIIAPPMPCRMRAMTKWVTEVRQRAADRAHHEHGDRDREHHARAETVGGPAAGRNEHRERQQIGGDGEFQRQRAGADIGRDRRQRGRNHRRVHVLHEQGGGHDQRDQAFFGHRDRGRDGGREAGGCNTASPREAIAEPAKPPKSCVSLAEYRDYAICCLTVYIALSDMSVCERDRVHVRRRPPMAQAHRHDARADRCQIEQRSRKPAAAT